MGSLARIVASLSASKMGKLVPKPDLNHVRLISSKLTRSLDTDRPPRPKPWSPDKVYTIVNVWLHLDATSKRLDENSKIIVVEGPVASGKTKLAKQLAEDLDMLYMPEANMDMLYINPYGYDLRQLDNQLPESCRSYDINNFLQTPKHLQTLPFQINQYYLKFSQYCDAAAHVLNTGQGVVLDRCYYSDFVFAEAMASQGYLNRQGKAAYYEVRSNTLREIWRPHLVIYLDVPVDRVMQNIKKRNLSCERNSPVLTKEYLSVMEKYYKQAYLKEISQHSELLVYDWSEGGESEIVVEDIEKLDMTYNPQGTKFRDWQTHDEGLLGEYRRYYGERKPSFLKLFNVPLYHVPEMVIDADDANIAREVLKSAPGQRYAPGFNSDMGDENIMFKKWRTVDFLPMRERKLV